MKTRRFFSFFLLLALTAALLAAPAAAADGVGVGRSGAAGAPLRGHAAGGRRHREGRVREERPRADVPPPASPRS